MNEFREMSWRVVTQAVNYAGYHSHLPGARPIQADSQFNVFVSTSELAYWGHLHLNRGVIGGRQIVPPAGIAMATALQAPATAPADARRNGFLWFVQDRPSMRNELGEARIIRDDVGGRRGHRFDPEGSFFEGLTDRTCQRALARFDMAAEPHGAQAVASLGWANLK